MVVSGSGMAASWSAGSVRFVLDDDEVPVRGCFMLRVDVYEGGTAVDMRGMK